MISSLPNAEDREILSMLIGAGKHYGYDTYESYEELAASYFLTRVLANTIIPTLGSFGADRDMQEGAAHHEDIH